MHTYRYPKKTNRLKILSLIGSKFWLLAFLVLGMVQFGSGVWIYAKAQLAQYLIAQVWQESLLDKQRHRPWPWADTFPVAELTINNHKWYVLAGANGRNLAFGPTHLSATPLPGELGNSVVVGHRDTQFNILKTLKIGEVIAVKNIYGESRYRVNSLNIAQARQLSLWQLDSADDAGQSTLTLITCYPFDSLRPNPTQRFVVSAARI